MKSIFFIMIMKLTKIIQVYQYFNQLKLPFKFRVSTANMKDIQLP